MCSRFINSGPDNSAPTNTQNKHSMKNAILATVTHVDPVKRAVRVAGIVRTSEVWVKIPESVDHLDLPPQGEGWQAMVHYDGADPYVVAFLPPDSPYSTEETVAVSPHSSENTQSFKSETITYSGKRYRSFVAKDAKNLRHQRPVDSIPGDKGFWNLDGNFFGVLRGKVNISKVSNTVQWFQSAYHKLTRIVSNKLDIFTAWGTIQVKHDNDLTKLQVQMANRHTKVREQKYDAILEVGACSSGNNFISFRFYQKGTMSSPAVFTLNEKGEAYYSVPDNYVKSIIKTELKSVGGDSKEYVGKTKIIEAKSKILLKTEGNATTNIGDLGTHPVDCLVKQPHLTKYGDLLNYCIQQAITPNVLGMPGIMFSPGTAAYAALIQAQLSTYMNDKTNITVAK